LLEFWKNQPPEIQAALIAAVVSVLTAILTLIATFILTPIGQYLLTRRQLPYQLKTEYEYEQRKQLSDTINRYRGLILNYADILKTRVFNLYENEAKGWLKVKVKKSWFKTDEKNYQAAGYYYRTTVYRFLAVTSSIQQFENEALYIDHKIAEKENYFDFVYGLKLLQKAATDVSLFDATGYDSSVSKDHIFSDRLRIIADSYWRQEGFLTREEFRSLMGKDHELDPVLEFFDDLRSSEDRLRWDRLVVFHLFLIAFVNTFRYGFQQTKEDELIHVVKKIRHNEVRKNLVRWLQEYKLLGQSVYGQELQSISDMVSKEMR